MKYIPMMVLILSLFCFSAHAVDDQVFAGQYDALELDRLERSVPASAQVDKLTIDQDASLDEGLGTLLKRLGNEFIDIFRQGIQSVAVILAIAALCALVLSIYHSSGSLAVPNYVMVAGALAITGACAGSINTIIGMGRSAINEVNAFSKSLLPSLMASVAATGAPLSATARYSATVLFADVLITLIGSVLFPLVYAYIAASTADAAIGNGTLAKIADFIRWVVSSGLKIVLTVFVTYLTVSGLLASTTDLVGAKTAKFASSGAVPVVGSVIADAAETVIAGAMVMKNAIGIFGMLTILSICLTPFLTLAVNYFLFKAAAAVTAPMIESRLSKLVENIGASFGIVLGMSASCALLMFLSILSSLYAVGAV